MAAEIIAVDASDGARFEAVVRLVTAEQQRPERTVVYVGEEADGIRAELDALHPPWTDTLRVVVVDGGQLVGCALVEWDTEIGRCWLYGPWIDGDDATWARWARPLVDAVIAEVPPAITAHELSGTVANERLRRLAGDLGWPPTEVNHAYVVTAATAAAWPPAPDDDLRGVVPDDLGLVQPLHEEEFPSSYFSAHQLIERAGDGAQIVVVASSADGRFAGYAAGRVQPDGAGYVDFVAVHPDSRRAGVGHRLVTGLVRQLLAMAPTGVVHLTVQDHRAPAIGLYEALGFRRDASLVGYRSP